MWDALSGGRLDQHSRILVFSDSLQEGTDSETTELRQTARAVVAMSHAGAHVFIAIWRPDAVPALQQLIDRSAQAQGVPAASLVYHLLPVEQGGRAVLESMRRVLGGDVEFPASYPATVDAPLTHQRFTPSPLWSADTPTTIPVERPSASMAAGFPAPASFVEELAEVEGIEELEAEPPPLPMSIQRPPEPVEAKRPDEPAASLSPEAESPRAPIGVSGRPNLPPISAAGDAAGSRSARNGDYADLPPNASRELLDRAERPGQVTITVTSSKGGSGKSTASILLAGSVARASKDAGRPLSVCLIDLDTRDGQVASLIGKFMPTALNIRVQPVWDEERIRRNLVHAEGLGVDTLLAPIRPRTADTVGPDFYRTIIRSLQRMYDVIVMDTSVQYLDPLIAQVALPEADEILFVTTLASTAVQGMARALREITAPVDESGLGIPREKIGIIVNQSVANVGMERDQVLAAGLGVPVVGVIPLATKDVLTATNLNRMFTLLDHPLLGPAYNELARACLPARELAPWRSTIEAEPAPALVAAAAPTADDEGRRRGLFRR
jgi:cellulose biosynthesis protein BcsQ